MSVAEIIVWTMAILIIFISAYIIYLLNKTYDNEYDSIIIFPETVTIPPPNLLIEANKHDPDLISSFGTAFSLEKTESKTVDVERIYNNNNQTNTSLDRDHINMRGIEALQEHHYKVKGGSYTSANIEKFASEDLKSYAWKGFGFMIIHKLRRLIDNKQIMFVSINLNPETSWERRKDEEVNTYKLLDGFLQYILATMPKKSEYIFTGQFSHGHENIFRLRMPSYHICDFKTMPTLFSDAKISSPNGLVVSKALYNRVEFTTDLVAGEGRGGFMVKGKLFINHEHPGTFMEDKHWDYKNMINHIVKNPDVDISLYGNNGTFSPNDDVFVPEVDGNFDDIVITDTMTSAYNLRATDVIY
jgi:hypothetical protein